MSTSSSGVEPTLEQQIAFHDRWNEQYRKEGFEKIEPESKARGEKVLELLESLRLQGATILELGCGTGWLTERLVSHGATTAVDLSPRAIEIARNRQLDAVFLAGDLYTMELPQAAFDVVVCLETIAGMPDQPGFVSICARATRPGGYLIITAQNKFVYERRRDIRPPQPGNIRKWLSGRELRDLLKRHFQIQRSITVLPAGDRGILRIINSSKLNRVLELVFSKQRIRKLKESLGLGQTHVVLARRAV